jgi:DnaK suppressor protein
MLAKLLALRAQAAKESGREAVKSARLDKTTAMPTSVAKAAEFAETRKISAFLKKQEEPDDTPAPVKKKKLRKPPYTRTELKELRQILENERQRLIRDMGTMQDLTTSNEGGTSRTFSNHQADAATDSSALETLFVTRRYEEERLGQVVRAIERLDEGTYGLCDMCEDEPQKLCQSCPYIPIGRLRAKPFAKLCIPCREQAEKRNKR